MLVPGGEDISFRPPENVCVWSAGRGGGRLHGLEMSPEE